MNSVLVDERMYNCSLWANSTETGLEPKHKIEPSNQVLDAVQKNSYSTVARKKMSKLTHFFNISIKKKTCHVETLNHCLGINLIKLNVNRQLNKFLHKETELIVNYRIHICTLYSTRIFYWHTLVLTWVLSSPPSPLSSPAWGYPGPASRGTPADIRKM